MQSTIPTGAIVTGKRDVFPSTRDGEAWFIHPDHPLADRDNRFTRRSFRDPHPLDNNRNPLFDDGNGYRTIIGSLGVKAVANDRQLLITPARTFDKLQNTLTGGVYFSFNKFQVMVAQQPVLTPGVDPSTNAPPRSFSRNREWSVSSFNVENLYDFRDDPHDGCDFVGDPGTEPRCVGVNPPFDYVPANDAAYQERLGEIAQQIRVDLKAPDVILTQEAEDQDICTVVAAVLTCGDDEQRRRQARHAPGARAANSRRKVDRRMTQRSTATARTTAASSRASSTGPIASSSSPRSRAIRCSARRPRWSTTGRRSRTTPTSRTRRC